MNIYFVNRYSKLKGPFDIIDSDRKHIMKVGDICLRDTTSGVEFLVVHTSNNSWNTCKCVGLGKNDVLLNHGNTLLLSFDGLHKRKGNITLLNQLTTCFREKVIFDFFENAIDILEYNCDSWDASLFPKFFSPNQEFVKLKSVELNITHPNNTSYPSVFSKYLSDELLTQLITYLKEGKTLKDAYNVIREKHPELFRKALMKFLIENPNGTIFDKEPATDDRIDISQPIEVNEKKTSNNYELAHEDRVDGYQHFLLNEYNNKEFKKLFKEYHKGDKKAYDQIVVANMKLVKAIARGYKDHGVEYDDLVQEGTIGLMTAIERFDPKRKTQFPAYARWWIHQALIQALGNINASVRIPSKQLSLYKKVRKSVEKYEQEHEYEPSPSDIEIEEDINPEMLAYISSLPDDLNKLVSRLDNWEDYPSSDFAADDNLMKESRIHFVDAIISKLKKKEAEIIRSFFGIGRRIETLDEIGDRMYLTRERVRQIKENAIRNLRKVLEVAKGGKNDDPEDDDEEELTIEEVARKNTVRKILEKRIKKEKNHDSSPYNNVRKIMEKRTKKEKNHDSSYYKLDKYKISNTEDGFEIRDYYNSLVFSTKGYVKSIDNELYCLRLQTYHFTIYRLRKSGYEFKLGEMFIHAPRTSPLYPLLNKNKYFDQIESIRRNYRNNTYDVLVEGTWYSETGCPINEEYITSPKKTDIVVEEKKYDKLVAAVGSLIIYDSKKCTVIEKKENGRLVVRYENGTIDNVKDDRERYKLIGEFTPQVEKIEERRIEEKREEDTFKKPIIDYAAMEEPYYDLEIEEVYVDIPSADPYVEVEMDSPGTIKKIKEDEQVNIDYSKIERVFDKKASSYKYFWFMAIISLAKEKGELELAYKDILIRMATLAWPIVMSDGIDLGKNDMIAKYLNEIQKKTYLINNASIVVVESYLRENYDAKDIGKILSPLLKNVPYRFLSPWIKYTTDEEVVKQSLEKSSHGFYALHGEHIVINKVWWKYIKEHYDEVCDFALQSFLSYVKQNNKSFKLLRLMKLGWRGIR